MTPPGGSIYNTVNRNNDENTYINPAALNNVFEESEFVKSWVEITEKFAEGTYGRQKSKYFVQNYTPYETFEYL